MMGTALRTSAAILALLLVAAPAARAHGGGLDRYGCHHNRIEGGYHCHRGPLAGRAFATAGAARRAEWLVDTLDASPDRTVHLGGTRVDVIDGDTVDLDGRRVRLKGIDAPEMAQACTGPAGTYPCGVQARQELIRLINAGDGVTCDAAEFDDYGRYLGVCRDAGGHDLNAAMVDAGWAMAYRHYTDAYVPQEEQAREGHRGIWAGTFTAPWAWRHAHTP